MPTIKVKANFPEGEQGFYQAPKIGKHANVGRRVKNGQTIDVYYDENYPLEDVIKEVDVTKDGVTMKIEKVIQKGQIASWMEPLEKPKKVSKKASKKKVSKK